jgi:hypothetical protein
MSDDHTNRRGERLRRYAAQRAEEISQHEANLVLNRALSRAGQRRGWTRHGVNAAAAVALSLILIAGGVLLEAQLRSSRGNPLRPATGAAPAIPNEIVNLDDPSQDPSLETPFDLKTGKVLAPVHRWVLPQNRALIVYSTSDCSSSTIRVVDRSTEKDTQPVVTLPDCFDTPIVLHGTSVLPSRHGFVNGNQNQFRDAGEVMYDWSGGRITKTYPGLSIGFVGGLPSPDGSLVYTLNPFAGSPALDITDLVSGARVAHVPVILMAVGLNPGGLGLSTDGGTLFVNLGDQLATFDARTGGVGPVVPFKDAKPGSTSVLPAWLGSIDADAKEGFEPNHGIAIDPKGRWVAALGSGDPTVDGIWIFSASGPMHVVHHIRVGAGFQGVAFSLDGSVLYALEGSTYVDLFDPQTGQQIKQYNTRGDFLGIAGLEAR